MAALILISIMIAVAAGWLISRTSRPRAADRELLMTLNHQVNVNVNLNVPPAILARVDALIALFGSGMTADETAAVTARLNEAAGRLEKSAAEANAATNAPAAPV